MARWSSMRSPALGVLLATGFSISMLSCGPTAKSPAGPSSSPGRVMAHRFTISSGGHERSYLVYQPAKLPRESPAPLVVVLHGLTGNGSDIEVRTGFDAQADLGNFLVVYPDGYESSWNTGDLVGLAGASGIDDVGFIDAVISAVASTHPIDLSKVYATGFSQGAVMAHHLGCESSRFAAVASMEGALWGRICQPSHAVSVLQIHGTSDTGVAYPGMVRELSGTTLVDKNISTVDLWRQLDGCTGAPVHEVTGIVTVDTYSNCRDGVAVAFYSVKDLDHAIASPQDFNEPDAIWRFFVAHPKAQS
jgi:polyhydroxybutyrate depolymerase